MRTKIALILLLMVLLLACDNGQESPTPASSQSLGQTKDHTKDQTKGQLLAVDRQAVIPPIEGVVAPVDNDKNDVSLPRVTRRPPETPSLPPFAQPYDKLYQEGVALAKQGHHRLAIAKLEEAVALSPGRIDFLYNLGVAYTFVDPLDARAEAVYLQAVTLAPQVAAHTRQRYLPYIYYNLASLYVLKKQIDKAFDFLDKAFKAGFSDYHLIAGDEDFAAYRKDPRFERLIKSKWPD